MKINCWFLFALGKVQLLGCFLLACLPNLGSLASW